MRAGRHPVHIDPDRRWYRWLRSDDYVDVWLRQCLRRTRTEPTEKSPG